MRITPAARALIAQMIRNRLGFFWRRVPVLRLGHHLDETGATTVDVVLEPCSRDDVPAGVFETVSCDEFEVCLALTLDQRREFRGATIDAYAGRVWLVACALTFVTRPLDRFAAHAMTLKLRARTSAMTDVTQSIIARGDLAHLALFLWASGASYLLTLALRESAAANRRFDDFVRELARFNRRFGETK